MGLLSLSSLPFVGPTVASLAGGLLGAEGAEDERHLQEQMHRENVALQKEFAQHGIRWRVEDAKAAGLHPLYALGAAGASYSPSSYVGGTSPKEHIGRALSEAGQNLSRAVAAQETEQQRKLGAAQLKVLEGQAAKDFAMAAYYASEGARRSQGAVSSAPFPTGTSWPGGPVVQGSWQPKAPEVEAPRTDDSAVLAGPPRSFFEEFNMGGLNFLLPRTGGGSIGEALEGLPKAAYPVMLGYNIGHYGKDILLSILQRVQELYLGDVARSYPVRPQAHPGTAEFLSP